jgi:hypothetical protein
VNIVKQIRFAYKLVKKSYLTEKGLIRSLGLGQPVDGKGAPVPWLTYPFVDFIVPRLNKSLVLFEYGSGNSTIFFSKHVKKVTSIEHNKYWTEINKDRWPDNCELIISSDEKDDYVSQIEKKGGGRYDIVIIDGLYRNECAINAINYLNDKGVIIFDDADRKDEYHTGFDHLNNHGFKQIDFWGLAPGSINMNCTSIFYRSDNCLNI